MCVEIKNNIIFSIRKIFFSSYQHVAWVFWIFFMENTLLNFIEWKKKCVESFDALIMK